MPIMRLPMSDRKLIFKPKRRKTNRLDLLREAENMNRDSSRMFEILYSEFKASIYRFSGMIMSVMPMLLERIPTPANFQKSLPDSLSSLLQLLLGECPRNTHFQTRFGLESLLPSQSPGPSDDQ